MRAAVPVAQALGQALGRGALLQRCVSPAPRHPFVSPTVATGRVRHALIAAALVGVLGGLAAGVVWIVPAWLGLATGGAIGQAAAVILIGWSVHRALLAATTVVPELGFGASIACGSAAASAAALITGGLLYVLYRWLRPEALGLRFAHYAEAISRSGRPPAVVERELARLLAQRAQYLDPALAAGGVAALLLFAGLAAATFLAWRWRAARARGPRLPRSSP